MNMFAQPNSQTFAQPAMQPAMPAFTGAPAAQPPMMGAPLAPMAAPPANGGLPSADAGLTDILSIKIGECPEPTFAVTPAGQFDFEFQSAAIAPLGNSGIMAIKVKCKIINVVALADPSESVEKWLGAEHEETFGIRGDTREAQAKSIGYFVKFGHKSAIMADDSTPLPQYCAMFPGRKVRAVVKHRHDNKDKTKVYAGIDSDSIQPLG